MPAPLFRRFVCATALFALTCTIAFAQNTIHVPADQATIQAGINAANAGDTVLVAPGTYYENVDFQGKAITVTSSDGPANTIVDGSYRRPTFIFFRYEQQTSILSGFTIRGGGLVDGASYQGGGILIQAAAPKILNNILTSNQCNGMYVTSSPALIQGNTISDTIKTGLCFADGTPLSVGGGVTDPTLFGGRDHAEIIGNTIQDNSQAQMGGGIYMDSAWGVVVRDNIIRRNVARSAGGLYIEVVQGFVIENNLITDNTSQTSGAIYLDGYSLAVSGPATSFLRNNTISGNMTSAPNTGSQISLNCCVSNLTIVNNIISGATGPLIAATAQTTANSGTLPIFDHNDVFAVSGTPYDGVYITDLTGTSGNISVDPDFRSSSTGDFHLLSGSPAIDTGTNNTPNLPATDLDGQPRIQNATGAPTAIIDMGAYEFAGISGAITTTGITSSPNPSSIGQTVTFTAQVTSANGVPTGTVTFTDGANPIGTPQPLDTSGNAAITTSTLTVGSRTITATYAPTGSFAASTAALTQRVNALADTTTLTATPTTTALGGSITLTATVTPIASGTVTFTSKGAPLGTVALINGVATLTTTTLPLGTDQITATYSGDTTYAPSTSNTVPVTITARPSTLTVVSATNPSPALTPIAFSTRLLASATPSSQGYIITLTITPITPGASSAITTQLTTNASGTATYNNAGLLPGQYLVTATFAGTSDLLPSTATSFTETVTSNPTVTTLTASPNPGEQNEPITFTSTIIATAGAAAPIGTITILDTTSAGITTIATLNTPVSSGASTTITFTTSTLPVGVHSLVAVFGPATGFVASQSQPLSVTILPQGFTLALSEPTLTLQTGHHHTLNVLLTSIGGLTATFTHSCGALPEYVSCLWGQASVTLPADGTVSTTLTMDTDQLPGFLSSNTRPTPNPGGPLTARFMQHGWAATTAFALFPLTLLGFKRRRKLSSLLSLLLLATLATGLTACGADKYPASTPPGTYIIPVTASAHVGTATYAQTVNLTLIVAK